MQKSRELEPRQAHYKLGASHCEVGPGIVVKSTEATAFSLAALFISVLADHETLTARSSVLLPACLLSTS